MLVSPLTHIRVRVAFVSLAPPAEIRFLSSQRAPVQQDIQRPWASLAAESVAMAGADFVTSLQGLHCEMREMLIIG